MRGPGESLRDVLPHRPGRLTVGPLAADGEFDAAEIDKELISSRLKQDVQEHAGKVHLHIADSVRLRSVIRPTIYDDNLPSSTSPHHLRPSSTHEATGYPLPPPSHLRTAAHFSLPGRRALSSAGTYAQARAPRRS